MIRNIALAFCFTFVNLISVVYGQETKFYEDSEQLYAKAHDLYLKEHFSAALKSFEVYQDQGGDKVKLVKAEYYIASCALELQHPNAERLFNQFVDAHPHSIEAKYAYFELATYYYNQRAYDKAIELYDKVDISVLNKDQIFDYHFNLGYSYFSKKDIDNAEPNFDAIKKQEHAYKYAANYYSGYIKFKKENYSVSLEDFLVAANNSTYKSVVPYMVVQIYYKQGRYEDLIVYAEEVLESKEKLSNKAEIVLLLAESHFILKNYESAEKFFKPYVKQKGASNRQVVYRLAYSELQNGNYEDAVDDFKTIASTEDSLGQYSAYFLGASYVKVGNKQYAVNAYKDAAQVDYNKEIAELALLDLIKIYYEEKQFGLAIAAEKDFLTKYPSSKFKNEVNTLLTESLLNTNNYNEAITYIEELNFTNQEIKTVYQEVCYLKAVELFNHNKLSEALIFFDKSIASATNNNLTIQSYFWKGEIYSLKAKMSNAITNYEKVIQGSSGEVNKTYSKAVYGLAYAYFNTKQYSLAKDNFIKFTQLENAAQDYKFYGDALLRIADCYYREKDYQIALNHYDKAIKEKVHAKDYAYFQKGIVLSILEKDITNAKANLDIVIKNYPNSVYFSKALYHKAKISFEHADYILAKSEFTEFIEKANSSPFIALAYLQRGISFYNLKKYEASIADFDYILENYCTDKIASQALSSVQQSLNQIGKSADYSSRIEAYEECNPDSENLQEIKYLAALEHYRSFNNKEAIQSFSKFLAKYPETAKRKEINYMLADAYYGTKQYDSAIVYFDLVYKNGPEKYIEKSLLRLGRITNLSGAYEKGVIYNQALLTVVTSKRKQQEALIGLVVAYYELENYDSSKMYVDVILNGEGTVMYIRNEASLYLAKTHYKEGDLQIALDEFVELMNAALNEYGAEANYYAAKIFRDQGDYNQSIEMLRELKKNFSSYEEWIGKAYLLIADNYISLEENFQAEATLQSLIENFPSEEIKSIAAEKLEDLQKAIEKPQNDSLEIETVEISIDSIMVDSNAQEGAIELVPENLLEENQPKKDTIK